MNMRETQNKSIFPSHHPVYRNKNILIRIRDKIASSVKGAILFIIRLLILIFAIITLLNLVIALYLNSLDGKLNNKQPRKRKPIIIKGQES